uniref:HAT C-terminal dimerisation domain-containing protein n=1 Tax=Lactuca sativa TaxID=4236 RepID=A0A9R1XXH3_LACSA|nr:hypothetical protein LSAT_V11C100041820 [Lactuca sativa]
MLKGPNDILDCKYLHIRCCAHIINLVVIDGLEEQFDVVTRIRNAVMYVRSLSARYKTFEDSVAHFEVKSKQKPSLIVDTRWNSTYLMLETTILYENAFERYGAYFRTEADDDVDGSTRKRKITAKVVGAPSDVHWEIARNLIEYLKIFSDVTTKISGSKYVTTDIFFSEFVKMHATITKITLSQYWDNVDNVNYLLYVAFVLDPRNKLGYITYCIELIYGKGSGKVEKTNVQNTYDNLGGENLSSYGEMDIDLELEFDKFDHEGQDIKSEVSFGEIDIDLELEFDRFDHEGQDIKSEVETYIVDGKEKRGNKFNLLGWWKVNSTKFFIFSTLARHVLAMPITTVASELAFSTGGRIENKEKNLPRIKEIMINVLVVK